MGLSYLVFPGARHTRFEHAIGCVHLMQKAIEALRDKDVEISSEEERALLSAILLHDVGHGPYSHSLEHSILKQSHEQLSLALMEALNAKYGGALAVAIQMFRGVYPRNFFNQLINSQLDIDRMDYLLRDSFFSAVPEGRINVDRLIPMLNVYKDGDLCVDEKGIYSVESFLSSRRFMYWQVYYHKINLAVDGMMIGILDRAGRLCVEKRGFEPSGALGYFLKRKPGNGNGFDREDMNMFAQLDDYDVFGAIKHWQNTEDKILSMLCKMLINRKLLGIFVSKETIDKAWIDRERAALKRAFPALEDSELRYFIFEGKIESRLYDASCKNIYALTGSGAKKDITEISGGISLEDNCQREVKYYLSCFKNVCEKV